MSNINWPSPGTEGEIYVSPNGDRWVFSNGGWSSLGALVEGFGATASTNILHSTGAQEGTTGIARVNNWYYGNVKDGWNENSWNNSDLGVPAAGGNNDLVIFYSIGNGTMFNFTKLPVQYIDWNGTTSRDFIRISIVGTLLPIEGENPANYKLHGAVLGSTCTNLANVDPVTKTFGDLRYDGDTVGTAFNSNGTICYTYDASLDSFLTPPSEPFAVQLSMIPEEDIVAPAFKISKVGAVEGENFGSFLWSYRMDYMSAKLGITTTFTYE